VAVSGRPRAIWVLPLQGQKAVGGCDERAVVVKAEVAATFVVDVERAYLGFPHELSIDPIFAQTIAPRAAAAIGVFPRSLSGKAPMTPPPFARSLTGDPPRRREQPNV
jgi:hypothetical protein